jgi:hypothetical protein
LPLAATDGSVLAATADAFVKVERKEEAVSWFEKALALAPGGADATPGLVRLRLELREAAAAADLLCRALAENPFDLRLSAAPRAVELALFDQRSAQGLRPPRGQAGKSRILGSGATYALSRRPLSRGYRKSIGPISKGCLGSTLTLA